MIGKSRLRNLRSFIDQARASLPLESFEGKGELFLAERDFGWLCDPEWITIQV